MEIISTMASIVNLAKDINNINNEMEIAVKTNEIIELAGNANSKLLEVTSKALELQEENTKLREKLIKSDSWRCRKEKFELVETSGKAIVYKHNGKLEYYACPRCFEDENISILQDCKVWSGSFSCKKCDKTYLIKPEESINHGIAPDNSVL